MKHLAIPVVVLVSLLVLYGAVLLAGASPSEVLSALFRGSLGGPAQISTTLQKMTPLLIAGIAVFLGLRAGLFNIGVEGQLVVGALACAAVASRVPGVAGLVLGVGLAIIAGAGWALPAGVIKAYRNGHEVITTIMLNNVAGFLTLWLSSGMLKAPGQDSPVTRDVLTRLPFVSVGSTKLNLGLFLGIAVLASLGWWLRRTVRGYELEVVGGNPTAAAVAGIDRRRVIVGAMTASGAIAGFAGAVQVVAFEGRFFPEISGGVGFDALGVALLAGRAPLAVLPAAFGFGVLATGGTQLAINGVPKGITGVVLGLVILIAAVVRYRKVPANA